MKNYIIFALSVLLLAGCSGGEEPVTSRLPLRLEASLSDRCLVTRAEGSGFDDADELLCYVRHVDDAGAPVQSKLVTFTALGMVPDAELYWDDFSSSNTAGTDLRTDGHGLQSYYGYCYNGGTPSVSLVAETGVLGWATTADQSVPGAMKADDLLWSASQDSVTYQHAKDAHGTLNIPYTHAMSKFTIVVIADEGFKAGDLKETSVTLKDMNEAGTFTAPTSEVIANGQTDVTMYSDTAGRKTTLTRTYEAVAVPLTKLPSGKLLAVIGNVDGNDYKVILNDDILAGWASGISGGASRSGVNYKLTVTLKKQSVSVVATLADWTEVSAAGSGEIRFSADVKSISTVNDASLNDGDSFSLWKTNDLAVMGSIATTATFDGSTFVNTPQIYWRDSADTLYFRALAQKTTKLEAVTSSELAQGTDLLWGTTAAHTGTEADGVTTHDYAEGAAINPRTGNVPLVFKHVMSNVLINLSTSDDAAKVDLTDATVTLNQLADEGTIDIATGVVSPGAAKAHNAVDASTEFDNLFMLPQTISDGARLKVTLADGTTYSLQLNQCKDGDVPIASWLSGNKYTYTVTLKKEAVQFSVKIQDWVANTGSGDATLDWD